MRSLSRALLASAPPPAAWTPAALGSAVSLWLDANDLSTIDLYPDSASGGGQLGLVHNWRSRSSSGAQFSNSQENLGDPYGNYGSMHRVADGSNFSLQNIGHRDATEVAATVASLFGSDGSGTLAMVVNQGGQTDQTRYGLHITDQSNSAGTWRSFLCVNGNVYLAGFSNDWIPQQAGAAIAWGSAKRIVQWAFDGTGQSFRADGVQATGTTQALSPLASQLFVSVGGTSQADNSQNWDEGTFGEILAFNRRLTLTEQSELDSYCATKWAVTLQGDGGGS